MIKRYNIRNYKLMLTEVLVDVGLYKEDAVWLLLGTRAQESMFGKYNRQIGGPALGTYQMEPATFKDIVKHFLRYKPELAAKIKEVCNVKRFDHKDLVENEKLAICFARLQFYRRPEPLPSKNDVCAMANYWKAHYNTFKGKGQPCEFVDKYYRFGISELFKSEMQ